MKIVPQEEERYQKTTPSMFGKNKRKVSKNQPCFQVDNTNRFLYKSLRFERCGSECYQLPNAIVIITG